MSPLESAENSRIMCAETALVGVDKWFETTDRTCQAGSVNID